MADQVQHLDAQAPVPGIINKLELVYGTIASFDILMQNFINYKGKTEKVMLYVTQLEGALNAVQQEYLMMLTASEVQKNLKDCLSHGLHKQLHNCMHYLYDDMKIMYPQPETAAQKAESEQEDCPGGESE